MSDEKPKRGRKWASIAEDQDEIRSRVKELLETHSTGDISTLYGVDAHSILPKVRGERHFTKRDWHRLFIEPVPDTRELELRAWKKFKTGSKPNDSGSRRHHKSPAWCRLGSQRISGSRERDHWHPGAAKGV